jgi:hypothetical protein
MVDMTTITDDIKASYGILENAKHAKCEHTLDILLAAAHKLNPSLDIASYKARWLDRWMKNKNKERNT